MPPRLDLEREAAARELPGEIGLRRPFYPRRNRKKGEVTVDIAPELSAALDDGFGPSSAGEDPFDAFVGLLSMLDVILGYRAAGAPTSTEVRCVEGWILGQAEEESAGADAQTILWPPTDGP